MTRPSRHNPDLSDRLLDREAIETPRRLSRDEHRTVAGPDWSWTRPEREEDDPHG
jgi:hypothetical protein